MLFLFCFFSFLFTMFCHFYFCNVFTSVLFGSKIVLSYSPAVLRLVTVTPRPLPPNITFSEMNYSPYRFVFSMFATKLADLPCS